MKRETKVVLGVLAVLVVLFLAVFAVQSYREEGIYGDTYYTEPLDDELYSEGIGDTEELGEDFGDDFGEDLGEGLEDAGEELES